MNEYKLHRAHLCVEKHPFPTQTAISFPKVNWKLKTEMKVFAPRKRTAARVAKIHSRNQKGFVIKSAISGSQCVYSIGSFLVDSLIRLREKG